VNAVPVNAGTRRVCLLVAVTGSGVLMSGVLLLAVTGFLGQGQSRGWPASRFIAVGLIAIGLFCGGVLVAIGVPGKRQAGASRTRRPAPSARLIRRPPLPRRRAAAEGWPVSGDRLAPGERPTAEGQPAPEGLPTPGAPPGPGAQPAPDAPPAAEVWPTPEARPAPEGRPDPSEEWMQALRPQGPPPVPRPPRRSRGNDGQPAW
jgi:hypothetical protein